MEAVSPLLGYYALMILPVFAAVSLIPLALWLINAFLDFMMGLWEQ